MNVGKDKKVSDEYRKRNILFCLLIVCIGLVVGLPVISTGFWTILHDGRYHSVWYSNFSQQLWSGDIYPRWLGDMNSGLGSPSSYYYPPVPYFITSLFKPFCRNDPAGWHQLGLGSTLAIILSGLIMWRWLRGIVSQKAAFIGAIAYLLAPYHLASDLYMRGAYAELWTFVWMPLVLLGVELLKEKWTGFFIVAISYGLLVATHLPTILLFSLLPPAYALFTSERPQCWKVFFITVLGMIFGIGLASVYLIPAMTMQDFVNMSALTNIPHLYYANNFLFSLKPVDGGFETELFWQIVATFFLGMFACVLFSNYYQAKLRKYSIFWLVVLFITLFIMTPFSQRLWEAIPKLQLIQFPWRATSILSLSASCLLAAGVNSVDSILKPFKLFNVMLCLITFSLLGCWVYLDARAISNFARYTPHLPGDLMIVQNDASEYTPYWVRLPLDQIINSLDVNRNPEIARKFSDGIFPMLPRMVVNAKPLYAVVFKQGEGSVKILEWKPRRIKLDLNLSGDSTVQISRFYFPAFKGKVNFKPCELTATEEGLISANIKPGHSIFTIELRLTTPEKVGWGLTLITILELVVLWFLARTKSKKTANYENKKTK